MKIIARDEDDDLYVVQIRETEQQYNPIVRILNVTEKKFYPEEPWQRTITMIPTLQPYEGKTGELESLFKLADINI